MKIKLYLSILPGILALSGCLTSQEPFYQDSDIKVDDRLVGTYCDETNAQSTRFYISKVNDFNEYKGQYYVTISESTNCSMKFGAVLFQIGTNRFFDMVPILEACDHLAANPPSLIELLQAATLQPMHLVVRVDVNTNGLRFGFADDPSLLKAATEHREYFQSRKPGQLPRMVADTMREREFLLRFGSDTNIFKLGQFTKPIK